VGKLLEFPLCKNDAVKRNSDPVCSVEIIQAQILIERAAELLRNGGGNYTGEAERISWMLDDISELIQLRCVNPRAQKQSDTYPEDSLVEEELPISALEDSALSEGLNQFEQVI